MSQEVRARIAKNLRYYRELNHYTREDLSLLLGFENSYISKVERCCMNITIDRLCAIAKFLNIEVLDLLK